jgi:4-amino-4-deoxy-L-arabinose transferase-like glycosyltransferase
VPRLPRTWVVIVVALAAFALLGWQGASTVGRLGPADAAAYLLDAQYLDAHGKPVPSYIGYEYSAPPLFELTAVGLEHAVAALPAVPLELPWNPATRLLWLLLVAGGAWCLASSRVQVRRLGAVSLGVGLLWGLDEAIALGKTQTWSAGQLFALAAALGLVVVSALIARELWPEHPRRMIGTAAFMLAYPVVLQLGVLFHPETTFAFLAALATLLTIRASARGWPLWIGLVTGALCGLALDTRQSAVVLLPCVLTIALLAGGRGAGRFTVAALLATLLVAGPWLGYAAYEWGNPLQGNLERAGDMVPGGEPTSFFTSLPAAIVTHPYRPQLANDLLPQLNADLWSDWFGIFHPTEWSSSSVVDRVTASSQSVLGLIADALALGGLAAFGVPSLVRVARRRHGLQRNEPALAFLALLSIVAFVAFVAQVMRYPQLGGVEIKASYLLFTAPAWAAFSVGAWIAVARGRPLVKVGLVAAASLYVVSYGTSLAATFDRSYPPAYRIVEPATYVNLMTSIQQLNPTPNPGGESNLAVWVANTGTGTALGLVLQIQLGHGMKLLGPPAFERGPGCSGAQTITCPLSFLEPGESTPIRFAVQVDDAGLNRVTAAATSALPNYKPADENASLTMLVGPYSQ